MILNPHETHEISYILGDLSQLARQTGKEYVVFRCVLSGELHWGIYTGEEGDFDPMNDILIRPN